MRGGRATRVCVTLDAETSDGDNGSQLSRAGRGRTEDPSERVVARVEWFKKTMLGQMEQLDGKLKSYAYVMAESALADAAVAEKEIASGKVQGPLHGVAIAVKDLC